MKKYFNHLAKYLGGFLCISGLLIASITKSNAQCESIVWVGGSDKVCAGAKNVTFKCIPGNAGANPQITWYVNGFPYGVNINNPTLLVFETWTYTQPVPIYCKVRPDNNCNNGEVTSNTITVKLYTPPPLSAWIQILPDRQNTTYCQNEKLTFTAIVENGGSLDIVWRDRYNESRGTGPSYSPPSFNEGDYYTAYVTSSGVCSGISTSVTATTQGRPIKVFATPSYPNVKDTVIEYNTSGTLVANGAGENETYKWYTSSTGGTLRYIGNNFKTPKLLADTTYYVCKVPTVALACEGPRKALKVISNKLPIVNAGPNKTLVLPKNDTSLVGTASDPDGSFVSVKWTMLSGPASMSFLNENTLNVSVSNLIHGSYIFKLTATDNYGFSAWDTVKVRLNYPPNNYNYVRETILLDSGILLPELIDALPVTKKNVITTYFDGLGREMQKVNWQNSPTLKDMVECTIYDTLGRLSKKYLPYSDNNNGNFKVDFQGKQLLFYNTSNDQIADDNSPFSVSLYESSPLKRVMQKGSAGLIWQPLGSINGAGGKTTKFKNNFNGLNEVRLWKVNNSGLPSGNEYYKPGQLSILTTTNEQNVTSKEYYNKNGNLILNQVEDSTKILLQTYYIYDNLSRLRLVLPPECISNWPLDTTAIANHINIWGFKYNYNITGQIVEAKIPGAGKIKMLYDKRNRLVLKQDSVQANSNIWVYTKYDALNRPIISGIYKDARPQSTIQGDINAQTKFFEDESGNNHGYTHNKTFPYSTSINDILSINYYDSYNFLGKNYWDVSNLNYNFLPNDLVASKDQSKKTISLITGIKTKVLKRNKWINIVNYYDDKNQLIQIVNKSLSGEIDRESNKYDFVGKLRATKRIYNGLKDSIVNKSYSYDHAGRMEKNWHWVGNDTIKKVILSHHKYNELGLLVDKRVGTKNNVSVQSIDYRYNIKGWLTSINNSALSNDGSLNDDGNDLFGMEIIYEKPLGIPGLAFNDMSNIVFPSLKMLQINTHSIGSTINPVKSMRSGSIRLGIGNSQKNNLTN